jgi:hypothetical protein
MEFTPMHRRLLSLCLILALTLTACVQQEEVSRWDEAQQASSTQQAGSAPTAQAAQAPTGDVLPGSAFNQLFPVEAARQSGFDFTYTQEKAGFAEAALSRDGTQVALLSVSDTLSNPQATEKYQNSTRTIAGYPAYESDNVTAILVADRFQVQAFSETDSFTGNDREVWLQQFDVNTLAALTGPAGTLE